MKKSSISTVSWKRYLIDDGSNPRIKRFLESRGDGVFYQICAEIKKAQIKNKPQILFIVHPHIGNAILIKSNDYFNVMDIGLKWFESRELYKKCADVKKWIGIMKDESKSVSNKIKNNIFI